MDWGPKPFKTRNCWLFNPYFGTFISDTWSSISIQVSGAFVFKEKLKILKQKLKTWNKEHVGDLEMRGKELVTKVMTLI